MASQIQSKGFTAFNNKYLDTTKGFHDSGFQTELTLPLLWHIVPENMIRRVVKGWPTAYLLML
jgi:hypothetical protein